MGQAKVRWWKTSLGGEEVRRIEAAIADGRVSQGAVTVQFERELAQAIGVPHVVATTSGSVALLLALWANDVGPGDEVILPNRTFAATAHAAMMLGAKIVLVDTRADLPVIDPALIAAKITSRTKAILPVHLNGRAADMAAIRRIAAEHSLKVVEDAAQALFSTGPLGFLGTLGDAGGSSLGMTKLVQTGQGGVVATRSEAVAERLRLLRNHGVGGDTFSVAYQQLGFNFKFTDIQASIGLAQLTRIPDRLRRLAEIYQRYEKGIADLPFVHILPVDLAGGGVPLYVEAMSSEREKLMTYLEKRGVETRKSLPSLHRSPHISDGSGHFPCSALFEAQAMYLPSGPGQTDEEVARVIATLHEYRAGA